MNKLKVIMIFLLVFSAFANADTYNVENSKMLADFYSGSTMWLPTTYLAKPGVRSIIVNIVSSLSHGGVVLGIGLLFAEAARILLNGGSLKIHEAYLFYGKSLLVFIVLAIGVVSGDKMVSFFTTVFFAPIEAITGLIKVSTATTALKQIADSLSAAATANQDSKLSWFIKLAELDVSMFMTNFFMMFALAITWIMSIYIGVMTAVFVGLSPICIPFFIFNPVSSVAWNWVKSMIAYPMMGAVGALVTGLLMNSGMLKFAVTSGALGQNLTAIASSVILILVIVSVPGITNSLFGGVMGSPMSAARSLMGGMQTAVSAGTAMAGAAMAAGGPAMSAAGGLGVSAIGSAQPGEDIRATAFRGLGSAAQSLGSWAGTAGRGVLAQQFPAFGRIRDSIARQRAQALPFGELGSQQAAMTDFVSRTYGSTIAGAMSTSFAAGSLRGVSMLEGESKSQAISRSAHDAMSALGLRPTIASSLAMADRKIGADGFDFDLNSREGNQSMMTDWVKQNFGKQEAGAFSAAIKGSSADLEGLSKDVAQTVGDGAMAEAQRRGVVLDYRSKAEVMSTAKQQEAMITYVGRTYGANMAGLFADKLKESDFENKRIASGDSRAYGDVMSETVGPLMEEMQLRVPLASSLDGAARRADQDGFDFSANTLAGNQSIMVDYVRRDEGSAAARKFAKDLAKTDHTIEGKQGNVVQAAKEAVESAKKEMYPPAPVPAKVDSSFGMQAQKNWAADMATWDKAKIQQNMVNFVKGRYDAETAKAFAEKLQDPRWSDATVDTSRIPEGASYDAIMSPIMYPMLEEMGLRPSLMTSIAQLQARDSVTAPWNFSMQNREANAALMTDYVRQNSPERLEEFSRHLDPNRDYLSGRLRHPIVAVANASDSVFAEAGLRSPEKSNYVRSVEEYERKRGSERSSSPSSSRSSSAPSSRGSYRGQDTFSPEVSGMNAETYYNQERSAQIAYLRQVARTANNGQYAEYADKVQIPNKFHPTPREGQTWEQASLGVMRALMVRQGFIGKNKQGE